MQNQPNKARHARSATAGAVVIAAFGFGLWLGRAPDRLEETRTVDASTVARLFQEAAPASRAETVAGHQSSTKTTRLRLRSTANVSSREAKAGDAVLFVTEQAVETRSGQHVPAGALVEAVISKANPSMGEKPGSLVIEIRALHVGNRVIPLSALPYVPSLPAISPDFAPEQAKAKVDIRKLGIRNQLRVSPEAEMQKEAVIEFQLVEGTPGAAPLLLVPPATGPLPDLEPRRLEPRPLLPPGPPSRESGNDRPIGRPRVSITAA